MKNQNIIIVGLQDWDTDIGSNCKNIALEFAKDNKVLYVNYPLDRITKQREANTSVVKRRLEAIGNPSKTLYPVSENIWAFYPPVLLESINKIKYNPLFDILNKRNNWLFARAIKSAAAKLGFRDYIIFNDNDIFRSFYLKEYLKPKSYIYYIRDFLPGVKYWEYHGSRLEPKLIAKSDMVVANSYYLTDYAKKFTPHSVFVGQGCDFSFLETGEKPMPADLVKIAKPIIGYAGALASHRLDIELIRFLAMMNPLMNFVFVGPEDEAFQTSGLHSLTNVFFLGKKKPEELPDYVRYFDACINPQLVNPVTIGNYPRKIDEYLALGKPVVATDTPAMKFFSGHVYLAAGYQEFSDLLMAALINDDSSLKLKRHEFAVRHTWTDSIENIYSAYDKINRKKVWSVFA